MITFFRNLRRSMLSSSSLGKYLFYAIGEILLVVIGILIALKINNWNQFRQDRAEEKRIYTSISDEIEGLTWLANRGHQTYMDIVDATESLLSVVNHPSKNISDDSLSYLISIATSRWMFGVNNLNNIYDALAASGELKYIQSDQMRTSLMELDREIQLLSVYEGFQTSFLYEQLYPYFNKEIDALKIYNIRSDYLVGTHGFDPAQYDLTLKNGLFPNSPLQKFRNKEFSNLLVNHIRNSAALIAIYKRIKSNLSKVAELLNEKDLK